MEVSVELIEADIVAKHTMTRIPRHRLTLRVVGEIQRRHPVTSIDSVATGLFNFSPDFVGIKTQALKTKFRAPK